VATIPSAPTANPASGVSSSGFTANWSSATGATGYRLDVSISSSFGTFIAGYQDLDVGNVTTKAVNGLNAGTTYYYRLRAYNTGGTSANSGTITVTTIPPPTTANPATGVTSPGFTANWSSATGASGYRLDVSTSSSFSSFVAGYQDLDVGNVTSKAVSGLNAGTAYYYRVRAYNTGGTSGNSGTITVTTTPPAPTANPSTAISTSGFTANWSTAAGAAGYRLDVSVSSSFSTFVPGYQDLDVGNVTSQNVGGLSAGTTYYYRVRAYNASGSSGNSGTIAVTLIPPAPTASAATATNSSGFTAN
jgi:phosphodiesterase/alkaline phosphatase D-like protein